MEIEIRSQEPMTDVLTDTRALHVEAVVDGRAMNLVAPLSMRGDEQVLLALVRHRCAPAGA